MMILPSVRRWGREVVVQGGKEEKNIKKLGYRLEPSSFDLKVSRPHHPALEGRIEPVTYESPEGFI